MLQCVCVEGRACQGLDEECTCVSSVEGGVCVPVVGGGGWGGIFFSRVDFLC